MIYIDRSRVNKPSILSEPKMEREKKRLHQFFNAPRRKKQARYNFVNVHVHKDVKKSLHEIFNHKCGYCESLLHEVGVSNIDHFRPKGRAMNLDGTVHENHYWWLVYEWENLYNSCRMCNSRKHTRFPVDGKRVNKNQNVFQESPWILDPCNLSDFKIPHFYLDEKGFLKSVSRKGEITIDIFSLNRQPLKEARANVGTQMKMLVTQAASLTEGGIETFRIQNAILNLLSPKSAYTSAAHFYLSYFSGKVIKIKNRDFFKNFVETTLAESKVNHISTTQEPLEISRNTPNPASVNPSTMGAAEKHGAYSMNLESELEKEAYFTSAKRIEKIEIVNFKIIKNLVLEFPKSRHNEEPWMVLLGENGAGKSSVLQAVALTLVGEDQANSLGLDASRFVNRNVNQKSGYVRVYLEGISDFIELKFNKSSSHFESNYKKPKVVLLAFGSTRLMSETVDYETNKNLTNLSNLFDSFKTLPNVEGWLGNPDKVSVAQFDQIAFALKNVLQLPEDKLIYRRKTKEGEYELFIKINQGKNGISVKELSAGYKSIITMTLNIIRETLNIWDSFEIAEGIVLIDEIGVHLHPKWKLQIITTLRTIFPAMNFIITTHEPLCLRGINEGEVALMKLDENNQVIALTDLPSPKALTIEQLITSKFFGLITSFDPKVEAQLNSFYLLKSKLNPTDEEEKKLKKLKEDLEHINIIDEDSNLEATLPTPITAGTVSLDAGWVNNPKHQEDLKQQIKAIWDKKTF